MTMQAACQREGLEMLGFAGGVAAARQEMPGKGCNRCAPRMGLSVILPRHAGKDHCAAGG
jgi:hypothetical protein